MHSDKANSIRESPPNKSLSPLRPPPPTGGAGARPPIYHRAMLAAGHKPSLKVYNALLSAYGKAQDIEQMTYYVNKMEANGIPPNTGSYGGALASQASTLGRCEISNGVQRGVLESLDPPHFPPPLSHPRTPHSHQIPGGVA